MLRSRVIPCLLVREKGLVKTVQFGTPKYVGDPVNTVRIFNEKQVDELIVLDIDASRQGREPDYHMIGDLAVECRMPLCYGGGVTTVEQAKRIIGLGTEKVSLGAAAIDDPALVSRMAQALGSQSVVVVIDVKRNCSTGRYEILLHNGTRRTGLCPIDFARTLEDLGAGEVVINSIDRDGMMQGYDLALVGSVRDETTLPVTALGGAGSLEDIRELITTLGTIGAAAGSLFVFKGTYRAVLVNYPGLAEKDALVRYR